MPSTEQGKEKALAALQQRRDNAPAKIDNSRLPAGSPMYYYCLSCGHLADTKSEGWFMYPPNNLCGECQALKDIGWLE